MHRITLSLLFASILHSAAPSAAHANWQIVRLINTSESVISITLPVLPEGRRELPDFNVSGDMAILVPGFGIIGFRDMGDESGCASPNWRVDITYNDKRWGFFYDGFGGLTVAVHRDGTAHFAAGPDSQIVIGDGKPVCR